MENQSDRNMENDEISLKEVFLKLKEWFLFLRSKWLIIFLFGLLGGIIGFIYASYQQPTYTATLSFALEDEKSGGGGLSGAMGLASSLGIDLGTNSLGWAAFKLSNSGEVIDTLDAGVRIFYPGRL